MVQESAQIQRLAAARLLGRDLVDHAASLTGPLSGAAADYADDVADRLTNCVLPRLTNPTAPLAVVLLGPSGVGKSVLLNSLAGQVISPVGALRPTTRSPIWLTSLTPDDDIWPPDLVATSGHHADSAPAGLVIIDTPDSHLAGPRASRRITRLTRLADVTVLVVSATRYGDAAIWQTIDALVERGSTWGLVVNRVPPKALAQIKADVTVRLAMANLSTTEVLFLKESATPVDQMPDIAEDDLRDWLTKLVPTERRAEIALATVTRAEVDLTPTLANLATELTVQADQIGHLRSTSGAVWDKVSRMIEASVVNWGSNPRLADTTLATVTEAWSKRDYAALPELVRRIMGGLLDQDYTDVLTRLNQAWTAVTHVAAVIELLPPPPEHPPTNELLSNWLRDLGNATAKVKGAPSSLVEAVKAASLGVATARVDLIEMAGDQAEGLSEQAAKAMVTARLAAAKMAYETAVAVLDTVRLDAAARVFSDHAAVFGAHVKEHLGTTNRSQDQAQVVVLDQPSAPPVDPEGQP